MEFSLFSQVENEVVALGFLETTSILCCLDIFSKLKNNRGIWKTTELERLNVNNLDLNNDNAVDYISVIL
jgi:hypothetical protein